MSMTTMKITTDARDRLRRLHPEGTLNDAVNAVCEQLEDSAFWSEFDAAKSAHDAWEADLDDGDRRELAEQRAKLEAFGEAAAAL